MNIGVKFFNLKRCEEDQEVIEAKYSHIFRLDFSMQSCRYDISVPCYKFYKSACRRSQLYIYDKQK